MALLDWIIVILWAVGTSTIGLCFAGKIKSTADYILTGRRLSWWQTGVAHAADLLDATDFVATTGQGYRTGMSQIGYCMHGVGFGFIMMSRWVVPLMYRCGIYTNAEYLELRFNTAMRVTSVLVQSLYRFVAMGMVVYSVAAAFHVLLGVDLWGGVWGAMALTLVYVFTSGQLGVAMAAIPQICLMTFSGVMVFMYAFADAGGLAGLQASLAGQPKFFHMAGFSSPDVPGSIYLGSLILTLLTYPIINQTVAQRFLAARSEVDARNGCFVALIPWCVVALTSSLVGICAAATMPALSSTEADFIYPRLLLAYLPTGLLGISVAALLVASMTTGAGIGTGLGGLFTIDIYARFINRKASDAHYLLVSRLSAALTILIGSLFARAIPAMGGLLPFYVSFTGSLFLPMAVPFLGGALYARASRWSGMAAVAGGFLTGTVLILLSGSLPVWLGHSAWRPFWCFGIAWIIFFLWSWIENRICGPIPEDQLAAALNIGRLGAPGTPQQVAEWIEQTVRKHPSALQHSQVANPGLPENCGWWCNPATYEIGVTIFLIVVLVWWW